MPHYVVPAGAAMAHGLIQVTLSLGANANNARSAAVLCCPAKTLVMLRGSVALVSANERGGHEWR